MGQEVLLPNMVEHKRMDDLTKSIQDGRLHDQKVKHMVLCIKALI